MLVTQINWTPPVGWPDSVAVEMTPYFLSLGKWGPLPCNDSLLPLIVGFKNLFFAESTVMNYHRVDFWITTRVPGLPHQRPRGRQMHLAPLGVVRQGQ